MDTLIQTPGEKIKEFRKQYKIKQYELCGNDLTRNLLSMIENNKATLTDNMKHILIENLKNLCIEKKIQTNFSIESLFESEENQVLKLYETITWDIKNNNIESDRSENIIHFINLLHKYGLKKELANLYKEFGDSYIKKNDHQKSYFYYLKSLETIQSILTYDYNLLFHVINNIMVCCIKMKNFSQVTEYANLAYFYIPKMTHEQSYKIHFNTILAYKNLSYYESALLEIQNLEVSHSKFLEENISKNISLKMILGNIYTCQNEYSKSLDIHKKLLDLVKPELELYIIELLNIIEIYIKLKDRKSVLFYLEQVIKLIPDYKNTLRPVRICEIYLYIGNAYQFLEDFCISKEYYLESFALLKETKEYFILDNLLLNVFSLIKVTKDYNLLNSIKIQYLELYALHLIEDSNLTLKLMDLYISFNDYKNIKDIIDFVLEF